MRCSFTNAVQTINVVNKHSPRLVQDLGNGLTPRVTARKQNRVGSGKEQRNFPSCIPRIFSLVLFPSYS